MPSNAASRKSCIHCGKIVKSAKDLKAHERLHLVDAVRSPFKCDPCGKMFTARGSLRIHHKIHLETEEERRPYKCKECEKGCTTRYVLEHHRRTHSQVHLPTLDSGFASDMEESDTSDWDEDTDGHSLTDDASRLFECADCGQKFASKGNLRVHKQLYLGEVARGTRDSSGSSIVRSSINNTHQCELCGKTYAYARNWKTHGLTVKHDTGSPRGSKRVSSTRSLTAHDLTVKDNTGRARGRRRSNKGVEKRE